MALYTVFMDQTALDLLVAFHAGAIHGSLRDIDVQRLSAFIYCVAHQPITANQIEAEMVTFLTTHPERPWRQVVAQDLGTRVCQGVELLRFDPALV